MSEKELKVLEILSNDKTLLKEFITDLQERGDVVEKLYEAGYINAKENPVQRAGIGNKVSYINYNAIDM